MVLKGMVTMIKEKTVCFTGHRPEKLPCYETSNKAFLNMIRSMIHYHTYLAAQEGYLYFISGVARGVDLWAAAAVLELKEKFPDIKLICAKPFPEHGESFKSEELLMYNNIIEQADEVICVSDSYFSGCYRKRNRYMVDNSSYIIGVVDELKSGTGQTIAYARKKGLRMTLINVDEFKSHTGYIDKKDSLFFD